LRLCIPTIDKDISACPIYISLAINTYKVLISWQLKPSLYKQNLPTRIKGLIPNPSLPRLSLIYMSKSNCCLICLVVIATPFFISQPILAAPVAIYSRLVAQSPTQPKSEATDEVFDDIVSNHVDKLAVFLDRGGSPNRYLHSAINAGAIDPVKMMLSRGANVNLIGEDGITPVMLSARLTYRVGVEMTKLLIDKGANVNARASKGSTPLMFASLCVASHYQDEYVKVTRLLIKSGAKVNVRNNKGDTPLSLAKSGGWNKIFTVLKKAGAKG
jgi:uncharacterized protein